MRGPGWSPLPWRVAQGFSFEFFIHRGGTQVDDFTKGFCNDFLTKFFGEEMGGSGGPRPPSRKFS